MSKDCLFRINIDGHYQEFGSEEDLHSFLRDNKRTLVTSLLSNQVMFSTDKTPQEKTVDAIEAMRGKLFLDKVQHRYFLTDGGNTSELKSVTKFITQARVTTNGGFVERSLVPGFDLKQVVALKKSELMAKMNNDNQPRYTEEEADAIIQEMKNKWEIQAMLGTSWHDVAQKFFEGEVETPNDIIRLFPEMKDVTSRVLQKYLSNLDGFKDTLIRKHGEDAVFLTEAPIYDSDAGIAGTSDLIVIDAKGMAHIYDYKTSTKSDASWNSVKLETIGYQLGFYRQILRRAGVKVDKMAYVPVILHDVDYDNKVVYDFDVEVEQYVHLSDADVTQINIANLMPFESALSSIDVSSNKPVHEFLSKAFNYEQTNIKLGSRSVDDMYDQVIKTSSRDGKHYIIWNSFNTKAHIYISKSENEQVIKSKIAKYLQQLDSYNEKLPIELHDFVRYAKRARAAGNTVEMETRWNNNPDTLRKLNQLLFKYIDDSAWHPLESDVMYDLGIVAFENEFTHEVDFVSLTANKLTEPLKLIRGNTLLGNVLKDREALKKGAPEKFTVGDVELLKIFALVKNNKEAFKDKKIGKMFAVNMQNNKIIPHIATQTFEGLQAQWSMLVDNLPDFELRNSDWEIPQVNSYDSLTQYVTDLFENPEFRITNYDKISKLVSRFDTVTTVAEKTALLGDLSNRVRDAIGDDINVVKHERRDLAQLLTLISEAIVQMNEIPITVEDKLKNWGNIFDENAMVTTPERHKHPIMRAGVNLVREGLNNAGHRFNQSAEEIRKIHAEFYEGRGASAFKIKTIGYNQDLFATLLEPATDDGKHPFRFRNPDTDPKLTPDQKKYIKDFLAMVNPIRIKKIEAMDDRSKGEAMARFEAGEKFNIPLMKTSMFSAFLGKNFKEFVNDYFREMLNPNNIYKDDAESKAKLDFQKEMFNQFDYVDLNFDARMDKLLTSAPTEFETDLEAVLAMYMLADAKEQEFNKVLPRINAVKMLGMLSDYNYFNDNDSTVAALEDYVGTTLFGKSLIAGESEKAAVVVKTAIDLTSMMMLGVSPFSGLTEFLTGQWATFSKTIAGSHIDWMFGGKELAKATPLVYIDNATTAKMSIENINFCDSLNEMFQVSEMEIEQLVREVQSTNTGIKNFKSKHMYWFNGFPNFLHRMVFFNAQLIKDGALKTNGVTGSIAADSALKLINGKLAYNDKLDERFKIYLNNKEMPENKQTETWKEQRAFYLTLQEELSREPGGLKADGSLARPYDNRIRNSLKSMSDQVFGNYDRDSKTNFSKTAFGQVFTQFKGWIFAKKHRYYSPTDVNGRQGTYRTEIVDGQPKKIWQGKVMEGVYQSFMALVTEMKDSKYNLVKSWNTLDNEAKENLVWLFDDLLGYALLSLLTGYLFAEINRDQDPGVYRGLRSLANSAQDMSPFSAAGAIGGTRNPMAIFGWGAQVATDIWGSVTGDSKAASHLMDNIGVWRTIAPLIKDSTDKSTN